MRQLFSFIGMLVLCHMNPRVSSVSSDGDVQCTWNKPAADSPNVYWINMDKSIDRKVAMQKHLDQVVGPDKHHRVRGFTLSDIYVPADVEKSWASYETTYNTSEVIPPRKTVTEFSKFWHYKVILSALFGRRKYNQLKEIGCTISHLFAMRQAIYDTSSTSKYALITEDDVQFLFNVDWNALVATGLP
jgi:GR25 family glycosyltransferase involved in LPS biosynthesis